MLIAVSVICGVSNVHFQRTLTEMPVNQRGRQSSVLNATARSAAGRCNDLRSQLLTLEPVFTVTLRTFESAVSLRWKF
jgi:hypothetical protein